MADRRRRKSLSVFRPSSISLTTAADSSTTPASRTVMKKKARHPPAGSTASSVPSSPVDRVGGLDIPDRRSSPNLWRNTLQKSPRPASFLGSWRSFGSVNEEDEQLIRIDSNPASVDEAVSPPMNVDQMSLLLHGEVQTAGSMFRKKVQYMVLTNSHLIRFKNRSKAAEFFPEIPTSLGRSSSIHHLRISSNGSGSEPQLGSDAQTFLPLQNIAAVYNLDDGRPYFSLELAIYDEPSNHVLTQSMQLNDPHDSENWLSSLRTAVAKAKLANANPPGKKSIDYVARYLESEHDYDPGHFSMFTVAQRTSKHGPRSSNDDLGKLVSSVCYLVVGLHKIHLLPLPRPNKSASSTLIAEMNGTTHAIVTISSINMHEFDDAFHIGFRFPFQSPVTLYLASSSVMEIIPYVRNAIDYLRPLWIDQPLDWHVPEDLEDGMMPIPSADEEDHSCFDRTLTAYCVGYNLDPSNIRYTVNYDCEDAPEFCLLESNRTRHPRYSRLELLAIFRALRYNESFHSISFRRAKLDGLHDVQDNYGSEHFSWSTKSGQVIAQLPRLDRTPLLVQELQCLALKSNRLRKIDFSDCINRRVSDFHLKDRGSGICEAIFPLCVLQATNVDWIVLNGIALSAWDLEFMHGATSKKNYHFRAIDLGRCSLVEDTMEYALHCLSPQGPTLESLDLSNNPARISPSLLSEQLQKFSNLRRLNLSRFSLSSGPGPILPPGVLMNWRLEFLDLSGTTLNTESVDSLAAYLMSDRSFLLRQLHVESCQMGGADVAALLESMSSAHPGPRKLHFYLTGNRLDRDHGKIIKAIAKSSTPTHLTMQALEYNDERGFRNLLQALCENKSLEFLDISRVSIPFEASHGACEKLKVMFETNATLKELNISGEQAHLEAVTLGRGISHAIKGLEKNKSIEVLRIENQALGFPGASALASVLQANTPLRELYCESNEISLQAFSTLVNAVSGNNTILYLPAMIKDRAWSRSKVDREINNLLSPTGSNSPTSTRSSVKRALSNTLPGSRSRSIDKSQSSSSLTEQDVRAAVTSLEQTWDDEIDRLAQYLGRNYSLASGASLDDMNNTLDTSRPPSAGTLAMAVKNAMLDRTPTAEIDRRLGDFSISETTGAGQSSRPGSVEHAISEEGAYEMEERPESQDGVTMRLALD